MGLHLARRQVIRSTTTLELRGLKIFWTKKSQKTNKSKTRRAKIYRVELRLDSMVFPKISTRRSLKIN